MVVEKTNCKGAGIDTNNTIKGNGNTFVFKKYFDSAKGSKKDVIYNFDSGEDLIDLSFIDADTSTNGNQEFDFSNKQATAKLCLDKRYGSTFTCELMSREIKCMTLKSKLII